jgi:nicotinamidase-related amidase
MCADAAKDSAKVRRSPQVKTSPWSCAHESGEAALLVIDFQTDFLAADGRWPVALDQVQGLLKAANRLISRAVQAGWQVAYIGNEFPRRRWLKDGFLNGAAIRGQPVVELDRRLLVVNSHYFSKDCGDAFHNPALDGWLRQCRVRHVVLLGVFANECIKSTASGAWKRGYRVSVVSDAVADADAQTRLKALASMKRKGATVMTSAELTASLASLRTCAPRK